MSDGAVVSQDAVRQEYGAKSVLLAGPPSALLQALEEAFAHAGANVGVEGRLLPATNGTDRASALVEAAVAQLGGLDVLIRHVPAGRSGPVLDTPVVQLRDSIVSGLVDAFETSRVAARGMTSGGAIVHLASVDALHAYPGRSAAAIVMAGLVGLVRTLGIELAERKVRVNLVIAGPMAEQVPATDIDSERAERTLLRSPVHRFGTAAEVAQAVLFVASPRAGFMTGQTLRVDGGWASLNQAPDGMKFR